jgi:hypothetical protein
MKKVAWRGAGREPLVRIKVVAPISIETFPISRFVPSTPILENDPYSIRKR